jgi:dipeptidyl aminopeptidase/acylaminoacyl peptidase
MNSMKYFFSLFLLINSIAPSSAQKAKQKKSSPPATTVQKPPLNHQVYDFWQEIPEQTISNNGRFSAFVINPQQGDGRLEFYRKGESVPAFYIERGVDVKFSNDSDYAFFKIKPQFLKTREAKKLKTKKEDMPKDSLGMLSLRTGEVAKWPAVISYRIPEKGSGWVAFLKEDLEKKKVTTEDENKPKAKSKKENSENGYGLVVKNYHTNIEIHFPFVKEYTFSKKGERLAFFSTGNGADRKPGVFVMEQSSSQPTSIYPAHPKWSISKLTFDDQGSQLAFVADLDTNAKSLMRFPKLVHWKTGDVEANVLADETNQPGGKGWLVNADVAPNFSKNGTTLFYGSNPTPIVADTTLLPEEIVNVEVWHWKDSKLQTQQKVSVNSDKKRGFLTAFNLFDKSATLLATHPQEAVTLIDQGNAPSVLLSDPSRYSHEHWDWNPKSDIYLVNTRTGSKKLVKERLEGRANASPSGKYIYWFSNPDTAWMAYSVEREAIIQLTKNEIVSFTNEEDDHPDFPNAYGVVGWTSNDGHLLVYDRYDVWMIDPLNPQAAVKLTIGRNDKRRYRYVKLDPEERSIDLSAPMLLRSVDETTKQEGLYHFTFRDKSLVRKLEGDFRIGANLKKSTASDDILFTKETFRDFPNWYHSDLTFKKVTPLTRANAQQNDYSWGSVELVSWNAGDGTPLRGLLYKPENFDSTRKYPMMTYFYEKNSDNLHAHFPPKPIRSYINFSYFTSNGYVVFVPDIVYQIGYPGQSAYNCVVPGVLHILSKGFIDKDRLGVSGHSWGGYQTAYLVTRTNLFKAAEAGAPVTNMTSAYGGIRWDTGLVRQAQYERTQSRIGGTLWEKPLQYFENSPLFFSDKVETPLLMMHNDEDGAVPWYQGIEYYLALKRLKKPVWMLNYSGEKHGLTQRQNMTDFTIRLYQFFDHYLKDAPMPRWMATGLPYLEKGINQGLEAADRTHD